MSLVGSLNKGKEKAVINLSEIRENPHNKYMDDKNYSQEKTDMEITALANSIEKYGQFHNLVVYRDNSLDDGKEYTLLSGAKRFRALNKLYSEGKNDGTADALVYPKPNSLADEIDIIQDANLQRKPELDNHELLYQEIIEKEEVYDRLKESGEVTKGLFKRPFVSTMLGISEGTVTNIKNEFEGTEKEKPKKKKTKRDIKKEQQKKKFEALAENIHSYVESACNKVKVSNKELSFKYDSFEDLQHLLELINLSSVLEEINEDESNGEEV